MGLKATYCGPAQHSWCEFSNGIRDFLNEFSNSTTLEHLSVLKGNPAGLCARVEDDWYTILSIFMMHMSQRRVSNLTDVQPTEGCPGAWLPVWEAKLMCTIFIVYFKYQRFSSMLQACALSKSLHHMREVLSSHGPDEYMLCACGMLKVINVMPSSQSMPQGAPAHVVL